MIKLSNYRGRKVYRDYNGHPYMIGIRCKINFTSVLISLDKIGEKWRCHFVEHASEECEFCGKVQLYSKCYRFTDGVRDNYDYLMIWLRSQQNN